jgi:hypothetical protein
MKSGWSSFFPCSHCGSQNVTGSGYCGNCGINLYYNCPDCQAWVDVTSSNCPNCRVKLDWPAGTALRNKPSSPALVLLLLGIVMLATGSIYLIVNNSGSANAVSNKSGSAAASAPASNTWPAINAVQPFVPYQNNSPSIDNADTADYAGYSPASASGRDTALYDQVIIIPANAPAVTETNINSPQGRSYLDTVYPTWGHCSGGRCRNITQ